MFTELKPMYLNQKSFYGKVMVEENENGMTLYSYNTPILNINKGVITALWDGWSMTTGKHINEFFRQVLWIPCNKKLYVTIRENGGVAVDDLIER